MRLELTRVGLLVELANHYTTKGALHRDPVVSLNLIEVCAFPFPGQILGCEYTICSYSQI